MEGGIAFGFWNLETNSSPALDPRYGSFSLATKTYDFELKEIVTLKDIELTSITEETHQEFFV